MKYYLPKEITYLMIKYDGTFCESVSAWITSWAFREFCLFDANSFKFHSYKIWKGPVCEPITIITVLLQGLWDLAEQLGEVKKRGLTEENLKHIPTRKFKETVGKNGEAGATAQNFVAEQCQICLVDFEEGDSLRHIPCQHDFHKDCIDEWLKVSLVFSWEMGSKTILLPAELSKITCKRCFYQKNSNFHHKIII